MAAFQIWCTSYPNICSFEILLFVIDMSSWVPIQHLINQRKRALITAVFVPWKGFDLSLITNKLDVAFVYTPLIN